MPAQMNMFGFPKNSKLVCHDLEANIFYVCRGDSTTLKVEAAAPSSTEPHQSSTEWNMLATKLMIGCPQPPAGVQ
jgi:hypothetical protein